MFSVFTILRFHTPVTLKRFVQNGLKKFQGFKGGSQNLSFSKNLISSDVCFKLLGQDFCTEIIEPLSRKAPSSMKKCEQYLRNYLNRNEGKNNKKTSFHPFVSVLLTLTFDNCDFHIEFALLVIPELNHLLLFTSSFVKFSYFSEQER